MCCWVCVCVCLLQFGGNHCESIFFCSIPTTEPVMMLFLGSPLRSVVFWRNSYDGSSQVCLRSLAGFRCRDKKALLWCFHWLLSAAAWQLTWPRLSTTYLSPTSTQSGGLIRKVGGTEWDVTVSLQPELPSATCTHQGWGREGSGKISWGPL